MIFFYRHLIIIGTCFAVAPSFAQSTPEPYIEYYDNGSKKVTGFIFHGHKFGTWTYWFVDGTPQKMGFFKLPDYVNNQVEYDSLMLAEGHHLDVFIQPYSTTLNGFEIEGLNQLWTKEWNPDGGLKSYVEEGKDGILLIELYPTGKVKCKTQLSNGKLNGKKECWYPNGKTEYQFFFENDIPTNTWYYFNQDGKIIRKVSHEGGK